MLLLLPLGSDDEPRNITNGERLMAPGYQMGLTVLVDPEPEDYYYPLLSSYGTKVTIVPSLAYGSAIYVTTREQELWTNSQNP
jgi:hypothetical protein